MSCIGSCNGISLGEHLAVHDESNEDRMTCIQTNGNRPSVIERRLERKPIPALCPWISDMIATGTGRTFFANVEVSSCYTGCPMMRILPSLVAGDNLLLEDLVN